MLLLLMLLLLLAAAAVAVVIAVGGGVGLVFTAAVAVAVAVVVAVAVAAAVVVVVAAGVDVAGADAVIVVFDFVVIVIVLLVVLVVVVVVSAVAVGSSGLVNWLGKLASPARENMETNAQPTQLPWIYALSSWRVQKCTMVAVDAMHCLCVPCQSQKSSWPSIQGTVQTLTLAVFSALINHGHMLRSPSKGHPQHHKLRCRLYLHA